MAVIRATNTPRTTSAFPPVFNWAGSKRRVAKYLLSASLPRVRRYYEPFLGSGAMFFALAAAGQIKEATLSDVNPHIIDTFRAIKAEIDDVLRALRLHALLDSDVHYASVARRFNRIAFDDKASPQQAADFIYALSQSFHSSWRETKAGNIRLSRRSESRPFKVKPRSLTTAANLLQCASLQQVDFRDALDETVADDFVFLDPPYLEEGNADDPRGYTAYRFSRSDLQDLEAQIFAKAGAGVHIAFCWGSELSSEAFSNGNWTQVGRDYVWTTFPIIGPSCGQYLSRPKQSSRSRATANPDRGR